MRVEDTNNLILYLDGNKVEILVKKSWSTEKVQKIVDKKIEEFRESRKIRQSNFIEVKK